MPFSRCQVITTTSDSALAVAYASGTEPLPIVCQRSIRAALLMSTQTPSPLSVALPYFSGRHVCNWGKVSHLQSSFNWAQQNPLQQGGTRAQDVEILVTQRLHQGYICNERNWQLPFQRWHYSISKCPCPSLIPLISETRKQMVVASFLWWRLR